MVIALIKPPTRPLPFPSFIMHKRSRLISKVFCLPLLGSLPARATPSTQTVACYEKNKTLEFKYEILQNRNIEFFKIKSKTKMPQCSFPELRNLYLNLSHFPCN